MGSTLTVPHQGQVSVNRRGSAVLVPMTTGVLLSMEGLAFLRPSDLPAPIHSTHACPAPSDSCIERE
jgi:hypothetical protein